MTKEQVSEGMVVFDTNTLLRLYEVGSGSRTEIVEVLRLLGERLWLPHQVALEFSRNRKRVVVDRVGRFKKATQSIKIATTEAVDVLEKAVSVVVSLRARNRTARPWHASEVGLDRAALEQRLEGALSAALAEVKALEGEHDLRPADVAGLDQLFEELDSITKGKIGTPPSFEALHYRVREALEFRYPNKIPPGYLDPGKPTAVESAGDYLLWREVLDEAKRRRSHQSRVLLVTDEEKPDWWAINERAEILHARPELVQEMDLEAPGTRLTLISLSGFLNAAREHLSATVSDETVEDVVATAQSDPRYQGLGAIDSWSDRHRVFEEQLRRLFVAMGYGIGDALPRQGHRFDMILIDPVGLRSKTIGVELKIYSKPVPSMVVDQVIRMVSRTDVDSAFVVTTSRFGSRAIAEASLNGLRLIDGQELRALFEEYLPGEDLPLELPDEDT